MKRKAIIISSIVFVCLATILTLLFTVFSVKSIEYVSHNKNNIDTTALQVNKGGVVFFLDKHKIKNEIQNQNPLINVINVEIKFPNKLVVHFAQREELFAIKDNTKDTFYICDEDFYVVNVINSATYNSVQSNAVLLENTNFDFSHKIIKAGDRLLFLDKFDLICNLSDAFLLNNRDITEQKALIKNIEIDYSDTQKIIYGDGDIISLYTHDDFLIKIYAPNEKLNTKIQSTLASLSFCVPDYLNTHYLEVLQDDQGEVFCKLSIKS